MSEDTSVRRMLAYLCIANEAAAGLIRKVEILDRFDLPDSEIAAVCACTLQAVRKARLRLTKTRSGRNA